MTSLLPYICADRAADALDFYAEAFGAEELYRLTLPDGTIPHAEIKIGDSLLMVCDEVPNEGVFGPKRLGGVCAQFTIDVADVDALDALWARATATGVEIERELGDRFYGRRSGVLRDPFGHRWTISTVVKNVPPEEMQRMLSREIQLNMPTERRRTTHMDE
jgi:PhnB protein